MNASVVMGESVLPFFVRSPSPPAVSSDATVASHGGPPSPAILRVEEVSRARDSEWLGGEVGSVDAFVLPQAGRGAERVSGP